MSINVPSCQQCNWAIKSYGALLCRAENIPKPTAFMRHEKSPCGLEGRMFEDMKDRRYAEHDDI